MSYEWYKYSAEKCAVQCVLPAIPFVCCLNFEISHQGVIYLYLCFYR